MKPMGVDGWPARRHRLTASAGDAVALPIVFWPDPYRSANTLFRSSERVNRGTHAERIAMRNESIAVTRAQIEASGGDPALRAIEDARRRTAPTQTLRNTTESTMAHDPLARCECGNDVQNDDGVFPQDVHGEALWCVRCGNPSCNKQILGESREDAIDQWNSHHKS